MVESSREVSMTEKNPVFTEHTCSPADSGGQRENYPGLQV